MKPTVEKIDLFVTRDCIVLTKLVIFGLVYTLEYCCKIIFGVWTEIVLKIVLFAANVTFNAYFYPQAFIEKKTNLKIFF